MPYKDPAKRAVFYANWCKKNREKLREYQKNYDKKNRKKLAAYRKKWARENPDKNKRWDLKRKAQRHEHIQELSSKQGHVCALCRKEFTEKNPPVRDHCHRTGRWRGLLHSQCNVALGLLGDSPEICSMAAKYLRKWRRSLLR